MMLASGKGAGVLLYIIGGEILFWCLLLGGLTVRYLLRWRTLSTILLIATPLVDLGIIALTYGDLAGGAPSDFSHGLAAFYVGFSIVFGPEIIQRFDRRFADRYTNLSDDQLPAIPERTSRQYVLRCLTAALLTTALLTVGLIITGLDRSFWLIYWIIVALSTPVLWIIIDRLWGKPRKTSAAKGGQ